MPQLPHLAPIRTGFGPEGHFVSSPSAASRSSQVSATDDGYNRVGSSHAAADNMSSEDPATEMERIASFIVYKAECRTPLVINLEDLPAHATAYELASLLAKMGEVPLHSFELLHTDDRIAGRRILEAIQAGAWLLLHIPTIFAGVESLLRDLGRRLFTITPNEKSRPLMSRFRLIIAMPKDTPRSSVFKKLALPLPIHTGLTVRSSLLKEYIRLDAVESDVKDCVVGAMFYKPNTNESEGTSEHGGGSGEVRTSLAIKVRPSSSGPSLSNRREKADKARPSSALTSSVIRIPSANTRAPREAVAQSLQLPPRPQSSSQTTVLGDRRTPPVLRTFEANETTLQQPEADPYEAERAQAERELFEKHASDVSQRVFAFLMRRYFNNGDAEAREAFRLFDDIVGAEKGVASSAAQRAGHDMASDEGITRVTIGTLNAHGSSSGPSAREPNEDDVPALIIFPEDGSAEGCVSRTSSSTSSRGKEASTIRSSTVKAPYRQNNHYGMLRGTWREVPVCVLAAYPTRGPAMPPLSCHKDALCTVQHPSLLSPIAMHDGKLIYPPLMADPAALTINDLDGVVRAIKVLATGLLALRDGGYAHRNICLAALVAVTDVNATTGRGSVAGNFAFGSPTSVTSGSSSLASPFNTRQQYYAARYGRPGSSAGARQAQYRLLVTNQAAPYGRINTKGSGTDPNDVPIADVGVFSRVYMSPEAILTGEWTYADDAWAVGVVLWQLIAGLSEAEAGPSSSTVDGRESFSADPFADLASERQVAELVAGEDFDPSLRFPVPPNVPANAVVLWNHVGKACLVKERSKRITLSQLIQRLPQ